MNNWKGGRHPVSKLVHGVGETDRVTKDADGRVLKSYEVRNRKMQRCYDPKSLATKPTYIGCAVHQEWHKYSEFQKWFAEHYKEGWQLDKDLLFVGNKLYGPDTCVFVPKWLNTFIIDSAKSRGQWPIGVCWHKASNKFTAYCGDPFRHVKVHLGLFSTPEEANSAWRAYKLKRVDEMKHLLDNIHPDLYKSLRARYERASLHNCARFGGTE